MVLESKGTCWLSIVGNSQDEHHTLPSRQLIMNIGFVLRDSTNFPTYPWNIPQTPNQQFMKEFLSFGDLGKPGVCCRGMLGFP